MFSAHFWPFFPIWGQKKISQKIGLPRTTSYKILAPCQISEKTNDTIARKRLDRRTEGQKDGQTLYFIGPFRLPLGVQKYRSQIYQNLLDA